MTLSADKALWAYVCLGGALALLNCAALYATFKLFGQVKGWLADNQRTNWVSYPNQAPGIAPAMIEEASDRPLALYTVWDSAWFWSKMDSVKFKIQFANPSPLLEQELKRAICDLEEIAEAHPDHPDATVFLRRAGKCRQALQGLEALSKGRVLVR